MSLYDNPQEYANKTYISSEQANIRCALFKKIQNNIDEARICPKCGMKTLKFVEGSIVKGIESNIICVNEKNIRVDDEEKESFVDCKFTSNLTEKFSPLVPYYDFDIIFIMGNNSETLDKIENEINEEFDCTWSDFVNGINKEDIQRIF